MVECLHMVQRVVRSIPLGGPIYPFYHSSQRSAAGEIKAMICTLWDGVYKRSHSKTSSPLGGDGDFPLLLSEWSLIICPVPYNSKLNVLSLSLNKIFFLVKTEHVSVRPTPQDYAVLEIIHKD